MIDSVFPLSARPFGVAISPAGVVLIGRQDANDVARATLADFRFGTSIPVGSDPGTLAISPNGATALVSNYNDAAIGFIDVAGDAQTGTQGVLSSPFQVKYHPDGSRIYVSTDVSGLRVYGASTHSLLTVVDSDTQLNGIAFSPSACKMYVSSMTGGRIAEIDATNDVVLRYLLAGSRPQEVAVSMDSSELWVADEAQGVQVYALPDGGLIGTVSGTAGAWGLAMTADGQQLYASLSTPGQIKIIDRASRTVLHTLAAGVPRRIAFDATGTHAVVADELLGAILIR